VTPQIRRLAYAWLVIIVMTVAYRGLSKQWLQFGDLQPGAVVDGTDYLYEWESADILLPTGETVAQNELYLKNRANDSRFKVPLELWPGALAGASCRDCVSVIHTHGRTYLVIRLPGGGSGGYYLNQVIEVWEGWAIRKGGFLSCGRAYLQHGELVFPRHANSCPEMPWGHLLRHPWENDTLTLSEF
jgi:hypothetical protein